jgi:CubicO group peptidase (beta-lactamase class C family)
MMSTQSLSESETNIAALDEIFQGVNRSDAPGAVVGVSRHGKVVYRRGFGLASIEHAVANTPDTRMRIGSTSKHFTCLAALLLVEDGKLDIDAPANIYLPKLPPLKDIPTLRDFMMHTSGYHCPLEMGFVANGFATQSKGWSEDVLYRQIGVNFAPRQGQIYCNGGYHLLSLVIERVSGMQFEAFLKTRIFDVLGMSDTDSVMTDKTIVPGMATLHIKRPGELGWVRGIFPSDEVRGEGGIISTVDDMLLWLAHMNGPKIVGSDETWRQMFQPAVLENGLVSVYGLGLTRHLYRGVEVIFHQGGVAGGASQMLTVPSHGLNIIVMTNGGMINPVASASKIVDVVLGDGALGPEPVMTTSERFKHLVGTRYQGASGLVIGFGEVGDKLGLSYVNSLPAPILRDEGDVLRVGFEDIAMGPLELKVSDLAPTADGGPPSSIPFSESGYVETLERLPAVTPETSDVGKALVGRFRSVDLDADADIGFEDGGLTMRLKGTYGRRVLALTALSDQLFDVRDIEEPISPRLALTTEQAAGVVNAFQIDAPRARHLRFERVSSA